MCQTDTTRPINMFDKNSALTIIYRHEKHTNTQHHRAQKNIETHNRLHKEVLMLINKLKISHRLCKCNLNNNKVFVCD